MKVNLRKMKYMIIADGSNELAGKEVVVTDTLHELQQAYDEAVKLQRNPQLFETAEMLDENMLVDCYCECNNEMTKLPRSSVLEAIEAIKNRNI